MNSNSLYQSEKDWLNPRAAFVIAFGNFEGTYYRYIKRYEAARNCAATERVARTRMGFGGASRDGSKLQQHIRRPPRG